MTSINLIELLLLTSGPPAATFLVLRVALTIKRRWPKVVSRRAALWISVLFGLVVMVVVASTIGAIKSEPPLPAVGVAGSTSIDGDLLAHVDGFWYVFDEQGTLVAIPDEEVTEVRITDGK